jgi:hypothetical protein
MATRFQALIAATAHVRSTSSFSENCSLSFDVSGIRADARCSSPRAIAHGVAFAAGSPENS